MNGTIFHEVTVKGNFALPQVALYLFSLLRAVTALATATEAALLGVPSKTSTTRRISTTTDAIVNMLCVGVGNASLARCLKRCADLVRHIASVIFLINTGVAALAIAAQPNFYPALMSGLAISGTIWVWIGLGPYRYSPAKQIVTTASCIQKKKQSPSSSRIRAAANTQRRRSKTRCASWVQPRTGPTNRAHRRP